MKKIISLLVVLAMLMSMVPAVFAAETNEYQEVTIPEAIDLAELNDGNKYLVRGTVTSVVNTTYGNMYIEDAEGNSLYVYGMYGVDGVDRYDAMETKPVAGDEVLLLGVLTTYNSTPQLKNAWLQELNGEALEAPEAIPDPEPDTTLTIPEAIELGKSKAHNTYTAGKYYVAGEITEITNTTYGNMKIMDAEGNTLTLYGTYDADGTNRFDAMENQPAVGDTITVYGIIGQYNGTAQMKNGWIQAEPEVPSVEIPEGGIELTLGTTKLTAGWIDENWNYNPEVKEYYYAAEQTGTLYITFLAFGYGDYDGGESLLEHTSWVQLSINGELVTSFVNELEVNAGDLVNITLNSVDGDAYFSLVNLNYEGVYIPPVGTEMNPATLTPDECPTTTIEIPAGGEVWYELSYEFYEHILYIYSADAYVEYEGWIGNERGMIRVEPTDGVVVYNVGEYKICIGNTGTETATFELDCEIPLGAQSNPYPIENGQQTVKFVAGGNMQYMAGKAPVTGTLTITVETDVEGYWSFNLQNEGDPYDYSDDVYENISSYEGVNTLTIDVNQGDELTASLSLNDLNWDPCDGDVVVTIEFDGEYVPEPDPGTEGNPLEVVFEMNDDYTVGTAYVTVPANTTVYYYAHNVGGMVLTVYDAEGNVVKTVELDEVWGRMPVFFDVTNEGTEEATYTLTVTYPLGNYSNPDELVIGNNEVVLDVMESYYYNFIATEDTLLVIEMVSDKWSFSTSIEHADGSWSYGYYHTSSYEGADFVPVTVLKLVAGDRVELTVSPEGWDEGATVNFNASLYAGTAENPAYLPLRANAAYTAWALNAELPAGEYVYSTMIGSTIFELTVNGEKTEFNADPMGWDPATFVINNTGNDNAVFEIELNYPAGTMYNPDELELGYNEGQMIMFDSLSHWYVYTATEETLLVLEMLGENWYYWGVYLNADGSFDYSRMTATHAADDETLVPVAVYKLAAGESFALCIGSTDGSEIVEFNANVYAGTAENPAYLPLRANEANTAWTLNAELPAGEYVYSAQIGSTIFELTVNGEKTEFNADPMGWDPATFVINNTEESSAVFEIEVNYPAGTMFNPDELVLGYNEGQMIMFDSLSHWYVYTATEDTLLAIEMIGANWYYWGVYLNADGSFDYSRMTATHAADEETLVPMTVIKLAAGESFALCIGSIDGSEIVEFFAMTYAGTEEDPIMFNYCWTETESGMTANADLPAGAYVYGARINGMTLTVNGVETEYVPGMGRYPCLFTIDNAEAGVVALEANMPVGSMDNPEKVEEGEYTVEIEEESYEAYWYSFVAPADGQLTITVSSTAGYVFAVNNVTAGIYSDEQWSDENPVNPMTIDVKEGDVVMIMVGAYDPELGMGAGATITVNLQFTPNPAVTLGDVNGDGAVDTTDAKLIMQYDLGLIDETGLELAAADVNGDGAVDTTDAKLIMQFDLGLITEFPKP